MKRIVWSLFLISLLLTGCAAQEKNSPTGVEYKKIAAQEAKSLMSSGNVIILDVRTKGEYEEGHIEKAVLLPDNEIKTKAATVLPDKNTKIIVYCRSGNRSSQAAKELIKMGYTQVYDLGGLNTWLDKIVK